MVESEAGARRSGRPRLLAGRALRAGLGRPEVLPAVTLTVGPAGAFYLYCTDPHEPGHWLPRCPFRLVTGALCPACGGTRMAYDLMHGQFTAAWHDNRALLLASPFAVWLLARWAGEGLRGRRWRPALSGHAQAIVLGTAVVWTLLRNVR